MKAKLEDRKHTFNATKVRHTVVCDNCGAPRVIYSNHAVGQANGPTKKKLEEVKLILDNGFMCGTVIAKTTGFYMKTQLQCGDYVESQYYNPSKGLKCGRIVTDDVCTICYEPDNIIHPDIIRKNRNTRGKQPLPICKYCYDKNVEVPTSGKRVNQNEAAR